MKKILFLALASLFLLNGIEARAQRIENSSRSTIAYIQADGRIENSSRSTIGYFNGERVENRSRSTIGYVHDGRVENASRSTIGYYSGVKAEWVAYYFFFMK